MLKLKIEIKIGNAATTHPEDIAQLVEHIAAEIRRYDLPPEQNEDVFPLESRTILDLNGNNVGNYKLVDEEFDKG